MSLYLKTIQVYQWIFCLFGLAIPPPVAQGLTNKVKALTVWGIYLPFCLSLIVMVFFMSHQHNMVIFRATKIYDIDSLTLILNVAQNVSLCFVHVVIALKTFCSLQQFKDIIRMIQRLEQDLGSQQRLTKMTLSWRCFKSAGCTLIALMTFLFGVNYLMFTHYVKAEIKLFITFFDVTMQIKCIEYGVYMQLIYELLNCLELSLMQWKQDIELFHCNDGDLPWDLLWPLVKNQMMLSEVLLLVKKLQNYFAWPILCVFYHNCVAVLSTISWAYVREISELKLIYPYVRLLYISILLTNLFILCRQAEKCIRKYQAIVKLVHNISLAEHDRALRMRVREHSLQLMHQKLVFSCNGYMDIDFGSFGKMLLVVLSYAVILVQFKLEDAEAEPVTNSQHVFEKPQQNN